MTEVFRNTLETIFWCKQIEPCSIFSTCVSRSNNSLKFIFWLAAWSPWLSLLVSRFQIVAKVLRTKEYLAILELMSHSLFSDLRNEG